MRSALSEALLGIGGILLSFGVVTLVLALLARQSTDYRHELPAMGMVATAALVGGAVMFGLGYLLGRMGRDNSGSSASRRIA
jgi:hypothetical protein